MPMFTNSTITMPPNGLSDGAIAGIVIGTILGITGLILLVFIIYKYRERFLNILNKNSSKSNDRSVPVSKETLVYYIRHIVLL